MGLPRNSGGTADSRAIKSRRGTRIKQLSHPSADVIQAHRQKFGRRRIRVTRLLRLSLYLFSSRSKDLDNLVKAEEGEDRTVAVHRFTVERCHTAEVGRRGRCGIDRHWCWNWGGNDACLHVACAQLLYLPLVDFHWNIEKKTHFAERRQESTVGHLFRFDSICCLEGCGLDFSEIALLIGKTIKFKITVVVSREDFDLVRIGISGRTECRLAYGEMRVSFQSAGK